MRGGATHRNERACQGFTLQYGGPEPLGSGSFGYVFEARVVESGRRVAVKKVYQDPGYKNRELPIMQSLGVHPNIVELIYAFKTRSPEVRHQLVPRVYCVY